MPFVPPDTRPKQQFSQFIETLTCYDAAHGADVRTFCWQAFHDTEERIRREIFVTLDGSKHSREEFNAQHFQMRELNRDGFCISVAINELGKDGDFTGRRRKANVSRLRAQVVDIDTFVSKDAIDACIDRLKPTMVVLTSEENITPSGEAEKDEQVGYKAHFYFLYSDEFPGDLPQQLHRYELIQLILACVTEETIANETGETSQCDSGIGIEKALRAPGFKHQKNDPASDVRLYYTEEKNVISNLDRFFRLREITEKHVTTAKERKEKERLARKKAREIIDRARLAKSEGLTGDDLSELIWTSNLESFEGTSKGNRQLAMKHFVTGLVLVQGLGLHAALGLAQAANEKNDPPLPDREVENLVEYFVAVKAKSLVGRAQERFIDGERPLSSFEHFQENKVDPRAESERMKEIAAERERDGVPDYDYSDPVDFSDVLSDMSILARLAQVAEGRIIGNKRYGVLVYKDETGCFIEDEGHVGHMIDEIVARMPLEEAVQDQFMGIKKDKDGSEEFYTNHKALRQWLQSNRAVTKCRPRIAHIKEHRKFIVPHEALDTHPTLINCPTGVIDLVSGELLPHDQRYFMTRSLRYGYEQGSFEPLIQGDTMEKWVNEPNGGTGNLWTNFVYEIMGGDLELCGFLQRAFGYALKGSLEAQVLFFFFGKGDNGKSLCLETILAAMGSYGSSLDNSVFLEKRFGNSENARLSELAAMRGTRFALSNEIEEGDRLHESAVKDITTGAKITAKFSHKDTIRYSPQFTSFLQGNNRPQIKGRDEGIWRRILEVPFRVSFTNRKDPFLSNKLLECGPQIISWMVAGAVQYHQIGLAAPEAVKSANRQFRDEMHPEEIFFRECLRETTDDERLNLTAHEIHRCFKRWWTDTGQPGPTTSFGTFSRLLARFPMCRTLERRGYKVKFTSMGQEFYSKGASSSLFQ
jgi:P4 family phage/plasmid primase-like protien